MKPIITFLVALGLVAAAHPATHGANPVAESGPENIIEVRMIDAGGGQWRFEPASIEAQTGDVVRFIQDDVAPHNVEFKNVPAGTHLGAAIMGPFLLRKGQTYDVAIDERFAPGEHSYVCTPHEPLGMVGHITVIAEDRR